MLQILLFTRATCDIYPWDFSKNFGTSDNCYFTNFPNLQVKENSRNNPFEDLTPEMDNGG